MALWVCMLQVYVFIILLFLSLNVQVCKTWNERCSSEELWKTKCHRGRLGKISVVQKRGNGREESGEEGRGEGGEREVPVCRGENWVP